MAKDLAAKFRIKPGTRAHLGKRDAADASAFPDRKAAEQQSAKDGAVINEWQDKLYAEGKRALLVVLQGVDTAGKDGTVRHVFNQTGPLGVTVTSFRVPSEKELKRLQSGVRERLFGRRTSAPRPARTTFWWGCSLPDKGQDPSIQGLR
jgi:polyphosphate kinase 2 (PPK2 family)